MPKTLKINGLQTILMTFLGVFANLFSSVCDATMMPNASFAGITKTHSKPPSKYHFYVSLQPRIKTIGNLPCFKILLLNN